MQIRLHYQYLYPPIPNRISEWGFESFCTIGSAHIYKVNSLIGVQTMEFVNKKQKIIFLAD